MRGQRIIGKRKYKLIKKLQVIAAFKEKYEGVNMRYYFDKVWGVRGPDGWLGVPTKKLTGIISHAMEL